MNYQDFKCPNLDDIDNEEAAEWNNVFTMLAKFAALRELACVQRINGYVSGALANEKYMELIYGCLPKEVRW